MPETQHPAPAAAASGWRLVDHQTGAVVVGNLRLATRWLSRLIGLQFHRRLPPDSGLLLAPCDSIHTCFCFFPLDVMFLSGDGVVLHVRSAVRPWRLLLPVKRAHCVLETNVGQLALAAGDRLALAGDTAAALPQPLRDFPIYDDREPP
jgi:uncharacterized membrane protein (UPF0127 family)